MTGITDLVPIPFSQSRGPDGIAVRGGVGSISFQWSELGHGAHLLGVLADELREILHQCGDLQWRLQMLLNSTEVASDPIGYAAVNALDGARAALSSCDAEMRDTAQRIELSRLAYAAAEAMAQMAAGAVHAGVGMIEHDLHRLIGTANAGHFAEPTPLGLDRLPADTTITVDGTAAGLLQRIDSLDAEGPGIFEVLKVQRPEGPVFVVVLPGTQGTAAVATDNPFDPTGIVEAVHYDSTFVADAVHRALAESGASRGDRVMVVGYSQGGMHAANIAQDPRVVEDYSLELVLTAGSPTGREASGDATYLHLEHADDWVHQVDGTANPDEHNRVTVTLEEPAEDVPTSEKGLGPAHKLPTYLAGAEAADASVHPSLVATLGVVGTTLGRRSPAQRHVFRVRRLPRSDRTALPDRQGRD
ncbi:MULTISPECIES: hypothetical protein [unclassified Arthrobacter]|uniref:hypothetical protein n=1 Tax=unclassified Arthrobacter TaxID=235627 RepID=UPI0014925DE3|nr:MULTISPECIES: hypothetical protein [unclassified Arthrobacter]MBE0010435.1 hypothetical protein [Arthrobacter sp. AET 35A]NOJ64241.1 hypothetical protein [Arthrobacter sp. 147(2020)]